MKQHFEELIDHLFHAGFFMEEAVEILEKTFIARALERTGGNQSAASKVLGIHRNTLQRKLAEYELDGHKPRRKPVQRATGRVRRKTKAG